MKILVFDTETGGFPSTEKPHDHPCQPDLLAFAGAILDEELNVINQLSIVIQTTKPVPMSATEVNGLTEQFCNSVGFCRGSAADLLTWFSNSPERVTGFNVEFDLKMVDLFGKQMNYAFPLRSKKKLCMMDVMKSVMGKRPKLVDAYKHCFPNAPEPKAHAALHDVMMTVSILRWVKQNHPDKMIFS
jgi:exonuclease I